MCIMYNVHLVQIRNVYIVKMLNKKVNFCTNIYAIDIFLFDKKDGLKKEEKIFSLSD